MSSGSSELGLWSKHWTGHDSKQIQDLPLNWRWPSHPQALGGDMPPAMTTLNVITSQPQVTTLLTRMWAALETRPLSSLYPWHRKWLINAEYVPGFPYGYKSTVTSVGKTHFKQEVRFVWHALLQVNPNCLLVIKCFFSKWSQTICLIGDWHSTQWFAVLRIHSKPPPNTRTGTRTHTPLLKTGEDFVPSSQDYRHWSHLQVIWMSSDVISEPRDKSQFKEALTASPIFLGFRVLSQLRSFYFFVPWSSSSFTTDFCWEWSDPGYLSTVFPQKWTHPFLVLLVLNLS